MKKTIISFLILVTFLFSFIGCSAYRDVPDDVGRNEYSVSEYRTTMQYYEDFKILQLADLHLGIETDLAKQLEIVENTIKAEKPDLIVLTGDNFMYASKGVVRSLASTLNLACSELTEERDGRLTKFTMTFGNHDNQGDYSRYFVNEVISSYAAEDGNEISEKKFAAFVDYEDDNLFGLTNFYIDLVDGREKSREVVDVKYRIHIIDSNTYHFNGINYGYDVIHDEQLEHAVNIYENATADKDYIGMAFFHIPFYEYEDAYEEYTSDSNSASVGQGEFREGVSYAYVNNGSYKMLRDANIVAFSTGHDHINYGDFIYRAGCGDVSERAIFSYGVKSTNQLYHDTDIMGYKTITLRDISVSEFTTIENVNANFKNVTGGYKYYEN